MDRNTFLRVASLVCLVPIFGCSKSETAQTTTLGAGSAEKPGLSVQTIAINGAGATFPFPLYSKWMADYNQLYPNVRINYQSIGSGGGIRQITAGTVDFGATDAPMSEEEAKKAPRKLVHIPTTLGSVVITYNVEGVSAPLKLTSATISEIYLGKIRKWNDGKILKDNPGVSLPAKDIAVVYRSDGSGTTAVFTDYLAKVSAEFKDKVGQGKSVKWPAGLGAKGNEGVTGQVKTTPNTIGYVEYAYATQNKMPIAEVKNAAGKFIAPSIAATTAAAAGVELGDELHASVTNPEGEAAYPISSYTYLLVYEDLVDPKKGHALANFVWWAIHDGQKHCEPLGYAPLPTKVVERIEARLKSLKVGDKPAVTVN
jgi:phosphate transport system substrate-binding protein